jgi:anhydro-N-acetylmuramic acid kinase
MSGTSLDGLDIACCDFTFVNNTWEFTLLCADTVAYTPQFATQLKNVANGSALELAMMHNTFGQYCADEVNKFVAKHNCKPSLIASHGQTIFHNPAKGYTTQIGCGATIAALTGITTVCDFRTMDVALHGQGAPLVPIADKYLFKNFAACLNLGGFANISFDTDEKRIAFDICAVNTIINYLCNKVDLTFDKDGIIGSNGTLNIKLLSALNALPYFHQLPPKSLGFEWLNDCVLPIIENHQDSIENKLRTVYEHISQCIANVLNTYCHNKTVLVSGGGAYNIFLMKLISEKTTANIIVADNSITEFKEAIAFAFLGVLRYNSKTNTLSSVTGASVDSIGGAVYCGG